MHVATAIVELRKAQPTTALDKLAVKGALKYLEEQPLTSIVNCPMTLSLIEDLKVA